jgi:hypothetical protein
MDIPPTDVAGISMTNLPAAKEPSPEPAPEQKKKDAKAKKK